LEANASLWSQSDAMFGREKNSTRSVGQILEVRVPGGALNAQRMKSNAVVVAEARGRL
jgi:hypothetical protein